MISMMKGMKALMKMPRQSSYWHHYLKRLMSSWPRLPSECSALKILSNFGVIFGAIFETVSWLTLEKV
tara:strand:+ start:2685 stop:2888 length:204 start_codon:yes stop_codon:yes gene_type:complete